MQAADPPAEHLLAGLRYLATRKTAGHENRLREILTTRRSGDIGREIDEACLAALLATRDDPLSNARFLVNVAVPPRPLPASRLAEQALLALERYAAEALLNELAREPDDKRMRTLVRLLTRVSKAPSPAPPSFWRTADTKLRLAAVDIWRDEIRAQAVEVEPPEDLDASRKLLAEWAAESAFEKAERLFEDESYVRAFAAFEKVVRKYPHTAYGKKARTRVEAIRSDPRLMARIREIEMRQKCESWLQTARTLAAEGKLDEARKYYRRILDEHPDSDWAAEAKAELARL